ncbi:hypothetical protein [Burkholderia territorii]|uniref:hypothetical protein n=1 Tax=Burkholderia territorii TaxID=1503055 RepID=UPI0018C5C1CB|nr:hypothetical protein [Burkholderia territorii]
MRAAERAAWRQAVDGARVISIREFVRFQLAARIVSSSDLPVVVVGAAGCAVCACGGQSWLSHRCLHDARGRFRHVRRRLPMHFAVSSLNRIFGFVASCAWADRRATPLPATVSFNGTRLDENRSP